MRVVVVGSPLTCSAWMTAWPPTTRAVIFEIAADQGIDHAEVETLTPAELRRASAIWITSSTREIFAVTRLDGEAVGGVLPGPLWTRMHAWLQAMAHE